MWRRVDLVWTDVSEELITSIFMVEKSASEELVWAGGCRHIPQDGILHSHRRENLKSYIGDNLFPQIFVYLAGKYTVWWSIFLFPFNSCWFQICWNTTSKFRTVAVIVTFVVLIKALIKFLIAYPPVSFLKYNFIAIIFRSLKLCWMSYTRTSFHYNLVPLNLALYATHFWIASSLLAFPPFCQSVLVGFQIHSFFPHLSAAWCRPSGAFTKLY
jgi:hypothetical protein